MLSVQEIQSENLLPPALMLPSVPEGSAVVVITMQAHMVVSNIGKFLHSPIPLLLYDLYWTGKGAVLS